MKECWYKKPAARLSALRIKKTLMKMAADTKTMRMISEVDPTTGSPSLMDAMVPEL